MKKAYLIAFITVVTMIFLQLILLTLNHSREAKAMTKAYLVQVEVIIGKNKHQEEYLLDSLKEDYAVLAKAVAFYLDHNNKEVYDAEGLQKLCGLMSIDEIHIFNSEGTITSSSVPSYIGYSFDSGEQMAYFKPMLTDKTLSMCQDITPNTAEGKPMVYAITWNEAQTRMVQIGIEPVRLLNELETNEIQNTVSNIPLPEHMYIIIADPDTHEIVGATNSDFIGKVFEDVSSLDLSRVNDNYFTSNCEMDIKTPLWHHSCSASLSEGYYICLFLSNYYFFEKSLESVFAVAVYLIVASCIILAIISRLFSTRQENIRHLKVFRSMSEIYYSLHLIDIEKNTAIEYSARNQVKESYENSSNATAAEIMKNVMHATMSDEYLNRGLEFTDISTLAERMKDKKIISMELLGKNVGWIRMSFITFEAVDGVPTKVIVATQIIDDEKKMAESLYKKSHIDELTGCYNRRAYDNDILTYMDHQQNKDYAYVSLDINGLKTVNDDIGHQAGDEMIRGVVECINEIFSHYGKAYRMGGDEFVVLLFVDKELMETLCENFDRKVSSWRGSLIKSISVSYGYVLSSEAGDMSMAEIAKLADTRMYEEKTRYYKERGLDRRRT